MIIATAGHVDHGKTYLVRNLTGVETDRLEEEQRRGLSISLGYAYVRLDDKTTLGFIDVPGHRRFINTMISGISGIDLGMLVVAADDGPMPQTREHLQAMDLLGVKHYLVVVSKCDRVDEQRVEQVCAEAAALLPAGAPIHRVSNTTGMGIDTLRANLEQLARYQPGRAKDGHFRMSVDRAFYLQGRGLVLTGTVASGTIAVGDTLVLHPQGKVLRVRGIHTQDTPAATGNAGERCAINISGDVRKEDIEYGDWLANESCIGTTLRFDARIRLLPEAAFALKHLSEVKLHIGAKHLKARLMLLQGENSSTARIRPGGIAFAQFVTNRPILCCRGDRFLLRDYGETATLGGGIVLDPQGPKYRKSSAARLNFLAAMEHDDMEDAINAALANDECTLNYDALLESWNVAKNERPGSHLVEIARINTDDGEFWMTQPRWEGLKNRILEALLQRHRSEAAEQGFKPTELMRAALPGNESRYFRPAISELTVSKDVLHKDGLLSAKGREISATADEIPYWPTILECLQKHGKQIPAASQLVQECGIEKRALLHSLCRAERDGRLMKINAKRYVLISVLIEFAQAALDLTENEPTLSVVGYRNRLACGRNIAVDVLEYFDGIGFTRRVGGARIILKRKLPNTLFRI